MIPRDPIAAASLDWLRSLRANHRTFSTPLAASFAAFAAFAVGAPVASAAVTTQPFDAAKPDASVTFSFTAPHDATSSVLVDLDGDQQADKVITVVHEADPSHDIAFKANVLGSSSECQQYAGSSAFRTSQFHTFTIRRQGNDDLVTVTVLDRYLGTFSAKVVSFDGSSLDDTCGPTDGSVIGIATTMAGAQPVTFNANPVSAPTSVQAIAGNGEVTLVWNPVAGARAYTVYVNGVSLAGDLSSTTFTVADLTNGTPYIFEVTAVNQGGESDTSKRVLGTPRAPVISPPVTPPVSPQPPATPQPPASPVNPQDIDGDGILNAWLIDGKPAPAPAKPKVRQVSAKSIRLALPKAPKGGRIAVYVRVADGVFARVTGTVDKRGVLTVTGLKRNTTYEIKIVKVNAARKQSAASKPVTVKTRKR